MKDENNVKDKFANHTFDGIGEEQNKLPAWWLNTLFWAIAFGFVYWFYFNIFHLGETPNATVRREMNELLARQGKKVEVTDAMLVDLSHDRETVNQGRELFISTCATCHALNAGGNVGPNLTDEFWIHGGSPKEIYATVSNGVPLKGMPAWGPQLGDARVQAAAAYVLTLRNTHVAGGKAPQGERMGGGGT